MMHESFAPSPAPRARPHDGVARRATRFASSAAAFALSLLGAVPDAHANAPFDLFAVEVGLSELGDRTLTEVAGTWGHRFHPNLQLDTAVAYGETTTAAGDSRSALTLRPSLSAIVDPIGGFELYVRGGAAGQLRIGGDLAPTGGVAIFAGLGGRTLHFPEWAHHYPSMPLVLGVEFRVQHEVYGGYAMPPAVLPPGATTLSTVLSAGFGRE